MQTDSLQSHNNPLSFSKNKQTLVQFGPNYKCGYAKRIQSESIFWSFPLKKSFYNRSEPCGEDGAPIFSNVMTEALHRVMRLRPDQS